MSHMQKTKCPPSKPLPNEAQDMHDNPQKQGVNDSKEGQQRQGIGTPAEKKGKQTNR